MIKFILMTAVALLLYVTVFKADSMPRLPLDLYQASSGETRKGLNAGQCLSDQCVVIFVAPWCPTCHKLTPMMNELAAQLKAEGIDTQVVIGKDDMAEVKQYAGRFDFAVFTDPEGQSFKQVGLKGVPAFYAVNRSGDIKASIEGGYPEVARLRKALKI
ncbi:TlpA family protein disulfide reductase [Motilimonas pumila]|nr:TlpA disulfide reductase family protein [Motilimonas pumila]